MYKVTFIKEDILTETGGEGRGVKEFHQSHVGKWTTKLPVFGSVFTSLKYAFEQRNLTSLLTYKVSKSQSIQTPIR